MGADKRISKGNKAGVLAQALKSIERIVGNIDENFADPKFRALKFVSQWLTCKSNRAFYTKVAQFSASMDLLRLVGFIDRKEGRDIIVQLPLTSSHAVFKVRAINREEPETRPDERIA